MIQILNTESHFIKQTKMLPILLIDVLIFNLFNMWSSEQQQKNDWKS